MQPILHTFIPPLKRTAAQNGTSLNQIAIVQANLLSLLAVHRDEGLRRSREDNSFIGMKSEFCVLLPDAIVIQDQLRRRRTT